MDKVDLIRTACEELLSYGLWDHKTRLKRTVKKYILRQSIAEEDYIFWPTGLLAAGLWHCRQELLDARDAEGETEAFLVQKIEMALSAYFTRWIKKQCPIYYLDDLLAGEVVLGICKEYEKEHRENDIVNEKNIAQYQSALTRLVDYAFAYPTDETGSFPYRAGQKNGHIFVDSAGLTCPFLYEYGRLYDIDVSMELAVKQIANFVAYGTDAATGLPYHGYDVVTGNKYGIIGWGRSVGWLLRGMVGCMSTVYGLDRLKDAYCNLLDAVLVWQRKDGYFSWQLQALEGPADTSATAMICYALQEGIRMRTLQGDRYQEALAKGIKAIQKSTKNGRVYDCLGECEGFAQYPQRYGDYPWALGVALMLKG
ncbi:MAG: glycoside hydrolase family 88 protein [Roseburia sp.]|nr:glycoside hydrolase family 88 protein [Roseburia sp.]MCM1241595.1 glycoside hydrolase family 88 protein [Roseburia sp.]